VYKWDGDESAGKPGGRNKRCGFARERKWVGGAFQEDALYDENRPEYNEPCSFSKTESLLTGGWWLGPDNIPESRAE